MATTDGSLDVFLPVRFRLFVCLLVCLFVCLFVCLMACSLFCLFVGLFVCLLVVFLLANLFEANGASEIKYKTSTPCTSGIASQIEGHFDRCGAMIMSMSAMTAGLAKSFCSRALCKIGHTPLKST